MTRVAPSGLERVFFVNSGAEANENALRMALKVTGRDKVLAITQSFHGRTAAAAAVTWNSDGWYGFPARPFATDFIPLLSRQLRQEFGGAAEEAADSLQGSLNAMANAMLRFRRRIASSGILDPLTEAMSKLTELLDDPAFLRGAEQAAKALGEAMLLLAKNIDLVAIALASLAGLGLLASRRRSARRQ